MPLHFVTTVSITAVAVGLGGIVAHPEHVPAADGWLLCGGVAGWFLAGVLGGLPDPANRRWLLAAGLPGIAVPIALAAVGRSLPGPAFTGVLVVLMGWQWAYSTRQEQRRSRLVPVG
jgi:hypothetical protein